MSGSKRGKTEKWDRVESTPGAVDVDRFAVATASENPQPSPVRNCWNVIFIACALSLMALGCERPAPPPGAAVQTNAAPAGQPQPKLPTIKLWVGTNEIASEIASTPDQVMKGMMFRTEMGENEGMLFVFVRPHRASFWMRNTLVPLSCAYIDPDGVILELHDMKPLDETGLVAESDNVQYVLEMRQGWFDRHQVAPGMTVGSERGTLRQTFFRR